MKVTGKAIRYGDSINTDLIIPGKYLIQSDPMELAKHAMEGLDPTFIERSREGVIIVAGENFGSGSSREHAPTALKYAGTKGIVAKSFARIFYRNAINIGLPVLECDVLEFVEDGDLLTLDLTDGEIENLSRNKTVQTQPLPEFILELIEIDGLLNKLKRLVKG